MYQGQKSRMGGGDRKFSKMVELLEPQSRIMVELLELKIARKGFLSKFLRRLLRRDSKI